MATGTVMQLSHLSFFAEIESQRDCFNSKENVPSFESPNKKIKWERETTQMLEDEQPLLKLPQFCSVVPTEDTKSHLTSKFHYNLLQWEELHQREEQLIQQAKAYLANLETFSNETSSFIQQRHNLLASEISTFMEHRNSTLGALLEASTLASSTVSESKQEIDSQSRSPTLLITQQVEKSVLINRSLSPIPSIQVRNFEGKGALTVYATLVHYETDEEFPDGLVGIKRVEVDADGFATFPNLKVAENVAARKQPSFGILFSLEDSNKKVLAAIKSDNFHVQSRDRPISTRTSKRRRDEADSSRHNGASSDEDYVQVSPRERTYETPSEFPSKFQSNEYNYVDITDYLTLPQKEAATRLGISESMLCKRFKECTRRKWPYRYVRKIDKVIAMLSQEGELLSVEDKKKLEKLIQEREERLQPVKIRITAHDRTSLPTSPTNVETRSPSSAELDSPTEDLDDEDQFVLETLEMLKTQRSPRRDC